MPIVATFCRDSLVLQAILLWVFFPAMTLWSFGLLALLWLLGLQRYLKHTPAYTPFWINVINVVFLVALGLGFAELGVVNLMFHLLLLALQLRWLGLPYQSKQPPVQAKNSAVKSHYAGPSSVEPTSLPTKPESTPQARNDALQLVWVQMFLLACSFILHQSLLHALPIFALIVFNCFIMMRLFVKAPLLPSFMRSMVWVIPITALLFLALPRLPQFWKIPDARQASTGLSDEIAAGSIEKLVQSDELAFRVNFTGAAASAEQLYWRVKVYEQYDGQRWISRKRLATDITQELPIQGTPGALSWQYQVIMEPSFNNDLPVLAMSASTDQQSIRHLFQLQRATRLIAKTSAFSFYSAAGPVPNSPQVPLERFLQLPDSNQKTRALARELWASLSTETSNALPQKNKTAIALSALTDPAQTPPALPVATAMVEAITEYLRSNGYRYSLSPGVMPVDEFDTLLFSRKAGFCSHYAGAATIMLRSVGIPARVVGGYLGGRWQDQGRYLEVLQRDAHAWVEYYADGQWHAYDPTLSVAPDRLYAPLDELTNAEGLDVLAAPALAAVPWLLALQQHMQNLDYYWTIWFLNFDNTQQQQFWQTLKDLFRQWWQEVSLLSMLSGLCVVIVALFALTWKFWWHHLKRTWQAHDDKPLGIMLCEQLAIILQIAPKPQPQSVLHYLQHCQAECAQRGGSAECAQIFHTLIQSYQGWQYQALSEAAKQQEAKQLRKHLRKQLRRLKTHVATMNKVNSSRQP